MKRPPDRCYRAYVRPPDRDALGNWPIAYDYLLEVRDRSDGRLDVQVVPEADAPLPQVPGLRDGSFVADDEAHVFHLTKQILDELPGLAVVNIEPV